MKLITRFPDGTEVCAVPAPDADTVEQLHDLVHEITARALGMPRSPTLNRVAYEGGNEVVHDNLVAYEEAAILAIQEWIRQRMKEHDE